VAEKVSIAVQATAIMMFLYDLNPFMILSPEKIMPAESCWHDNKFHLKHTDFCQRFRYYT
jgi:hypothetical protein